MRRESGRWWCGSAVLLGAALALTGCSDDSGGDAAAPPSPSASASASEPAPSTTTPTVASPTLPPEAQKPDVAGAEAFIRYYLDAVNYGYATGDLGAMRSVSQPECVACAALETLIEEGHADDQTITGAQLRVREVTVTPGDATAGLSAVAIIRQDPGQVLGADGQGVEDIPGSDEKLYRFLVEYADGWSIVEMATHDATS